MADPAIQATSNYNGGGSTTSSAAFSSNVTAGNVIAVSVWTRSSGDVITGVSDTLGNSYGSAVQQSLLPGDVTTSIYIFFAFSIAGGANTVKATASSNVEIIVTAVELPASGGVRVSNANGSAASGDPSVSLAGTVANDVVFAFASNGGGGAYSSSSIGSNSGFAEAVLFADVAYTFDGNSPGGTITVTANGGTAVDHEILAAALKPKSAGTFLMLGDPF